MTQRKAILRPRRRTTLEGLPPDLASWFAGEPRPEGGHAIPWAALIYPDHLLLYERWQAWAGDHPGARPPAGFEWIAEPPPERINGMPYDEAVAVARRMMMRRIK